MQKQFEFFKKFFNKSFLSVLAGYFAFAIIFSYLAKILANIKILVKIDFLIQQTIINLRLEFLNGALKIFTDLSDTTATAILTIAVATIFFFSKYRVYSLGLLLSVGVSELATLMTKNVIVRHRPPEELMLVAAHSPSFPSGHAIAAMAFFGFLLYFFHKNIKNISARITLTAILSAIILLAGFTRVYLGVHWPSDVIGGYIIGGAWLLAIVWFIKNKSALEN